MQKERIIGSMLLFVIIFFTKMHALSEWDEYSRWEHALRQIPTQEASIEAKQKIETIIEKAEKYDYSLGEIIAAIEACHPNNFMSPQLIDLDIFVIPSRFGVPSASFSHSMVSVESITRYGPSCSYMKPPGETSCEAYQRKMSCAEDWLQFSDRWFNQFNNYVPEAYNRINSTCNEPTFKPSKVQTQDLEKRKFRAQLIVLYLRRENQAMTNRAINAIIKFFKWHHMYDVCLRQVSDPVKVPKDGSVIDE